MQVVTGKVWKQCQLAIFPTLHMVHNFSPSGFDYILNVTFKVGQAGAVLLTPQKL